jgi:hypothetical protein
MVSSASCSALAVRHPLSNRGPVCAGFLLNFAEIAIAGIEPKLQKLSAWARGRQRMRQFFSFWWMCAKKAFWGNTAFANDWQWVFGVPAVTGLVGFLASNKGASELSTGYPIFDGILSALAAFIVTWCVAFVVRLLNAPVLLYQGLKDIIEPHQEDKPLPDLPIHDLFSYIDPEFLTRTDDSVGDRWDQVGNDVRDRAALGALKIWGRAVRDGVDTLLGQREALRLIEPSYWTTAFFTYSFFDSSAGDAPHTYLKYGLSGVEYTDLQVNRAEALRIWPKKDTNRTRG